MERVTIKAGKGLKVRLADGTWLEKDGREVARDPFVERLIRDEDVVVVATDVAPPTSANSSPAAQASAPAAKEGSKS